MSQKPGTPERLCWLVAYHSASHDTQVLPKNYYHRQRPQTSKFRNTTCTFYHTLPPPFISFIPCSSKPIPTPWGSPSSHLAPRGCRLAPRYHTLALQCRYTKKPGKPDQTAPPRRPHAPPKTARTACENAPGANVLSPIDTPPPQQHQRGVALTLYPPHGAKSHHGVARRKNEAT